MMQSSQLRMYHGGQIDHLFSNGIYRGSSGAVQIFDAGLSPLRLLLLHMTKDIITLVCDRVLISDNSY